jgi:hypothetical protein
MTEQDQEIVFSVVCNRSRRSEIGRVARQIGVKLFSESQPVFRKLSETERQIVGQFVAGVVSSDEILERLRQEVERRRLAVSPVQRVNIEKFGGEEGFKKILADRNRIIWVKGGVS